MDVFVSSVLCNIVSNIVYDIGKCAIGKFQFGKNQINKDDVIKYVSGEMEGKYEDLCGVGVLVGYLDTPLVKDTINNYVIYKITGILHSDFARNVKIKNKPYSISEEEVVKYLTSKLLERCREVNPICMPSKRDSDNFFIDMFKISSQYIYEKLGKNDKTFTFFINNRIDYVGDTMFSKIQEVISILEKSMEKEVVNRERGYEETKEHYIKLLKENHSTAHIYLLNRFELCAFYVPPFLAVRSDLKLISEMDFIRKKERMMAFESREYNKEQFFDDWKYIFERNNIVYITGGAGYGKSLFMNKIITDFENMNIFDGKEYLVIYGELKAFYPNNSDDPISVVEFLQNSMINETLMEKDIVTKEFIQYYLNIGRCIILFDALDEVEKTKRKSLHRKVVSYFKSENPNNKICITSRSRGFFPEKEIEVLDIEPLDRTQIETYVDNIIRLGEFDIKDKEAFLNQSNILVKKGFLCSFLVLSLLINIYKAERELPENKLDLYQKCFEYIAHKREKEKSSDKNRWKLIAPLMKDNTFMELSNLCLPNNTEADKEDIKNTLMNVYKTKYSSEHETEEAVDEFLAFCSDRTELFVPSAGEDKFNFFHRSFFEYFYSQYLFIRKNTAEEIYECITKFDVDSEIFELTFAMIKQKNENKYQDLIEYIYSNMFDSATDENEKLIAFNILLLGMQVIDDEVYKKRLIEYIVQNSDFIVKKEKNIHSQWILVNLIKNNYEYLENINNTFKERAIISALSSFVDIYQEIKRVAKQMSDNENEQDEIDNYMRFRYLGFYYNGFYTQTYFTQHNLKDEFENITIEQINEYARICKLTKKQITRIRNVWTDYKESDSLLKSKIDQVLFSETVS